MEAEPILVLCMEDSTSLARLLETRLERQGYEVTIALNGEEGLARYYAGNYDILTIDLNMPILSGLEVLHQLAAEGPLPPIIMITGSGNEQTAIEVMKLGARDYIVTGHSMSLS